MAASVTGIRGETVTTSVFMISFAHIVLFPFITLYTSGHLLGAFAISIPFNPRIQHPVITEILHKMV
jgi:hypothetical protein